MVYKRLNGEARMKKSKVQSWPALKEKSERVCQIQQVFYFLDRKSFVFRTFQSFVNNNFIRFTISITTNIIWIKVREIKKMSLILSLVKIRLRIQINYIHSDNKSKDMSYTRTRLLKSNQRQLYWQTRYTIYDQRAKQDMSSKEFIQMFAKYEIITVTGYSRKYIIFCSFWNTSSTIEILSYNRKSNWFSLLLPIDGRHYDYYNQTFVIWFLYSSENVKHIWYLTISCCWLFEVKILSNI